MTDPANPPHAGAAGPDGSHSGDEVDSPREFDEMINLEEFEKPAEPKPKLAGRQSPPLDPQNAASRIAPRLWKGLWKSGKYVMAMVGASVFAAGAFVAGNLLALPMREELMERPKLFQACEAAGIKADGSEPAFNILVFVKSDFSAAGSSIDELKRDFAAAGNVMKELKYLSGIEHRPGTRYSFGFGVIPVCDPAGQNIGSQFSSDSTAIAVIIVERVKDQVRLEVVFRGGGQKISLNAMSDSNWSDAHRAALQDAIFEAVHRRGGGWKGIWGTPVPATSPRFEEVRIHARSSLRMVETRLFESGKGAKSDMLVAGALHELSRLQEAHDRLKIAGCDPRDASQSLTPDEIGRLTRAGIVKSELVANAADPAGPPLRMASLECLLAALADDGDLARREMVVSRAAQLLRDILRDMSERTRNLRGLEAYIDRLLPELQALVNRPGTWRTAPRMVQLENYFELKRRDIGQIRVQNRRRVMRNVGTSIRRRRAAVQRRYASAQATAASGAQSIEVPRPDPGMSRPQAEAMRTAAAHGKSHAPGARMRVGTMPVTVRHGSRSAAPQVGGSMRRKRPQCRYRMYRPAGDTRIGVRWCPTSWRPRHGRRAAS